ncbi:MAG: hypothetical protein ACRENS_04935 [Candidatus Eiseniibacteriota bacterium]
MTDSRRLAGLIGPVLVALAATEILNYRIWDTSIPQLVYLNGTLLVIAGISILRAHHRWVAGWPLFLTLAGWIALLGGLYRMLAPEGRQAPRTPALYAGLALMGAVGLLLTYQAYRPKRRGSGADR